MHKTSTNPMGVNQNSNSQLQFYSKKPKQLEVDRLVVYKKENQVKTQQILESFNNDYELLSDHIKIVKDQIKIRRPDVSRDITLDLNNTIVEETTANRYEKRIKIQKNHQSQLRNQSRNQTQQLVYTEYDDGDLQQNIDGNKSVDVIKSRPQNLLSGKIIQKNKGNFQSLVRTSNNKQTNLKYMLINNANSSNKNLNSQFSNQRELNQRSQINLLRTNDQNKIMKIPQIIPPLSLNQLSNTQIQLTNMKDNPSQNYQELSYKTQQVLQDTNMNATFSINQKHKSVNDQMSTTFSNNLPLASIHKQSTLQNPANQFNIIEKKDSQDSYETPPTQIDFTIRDQTNQKENTTGVAFGQVILGDSESYENDEFIEETILTKEKQSLQNQRSLRYQQDSIRYEDQKKDRFQQSNTSKFRDRLNLKEYALQQPDQNEVKTESQLESLQSNDIIKNYGLDNKEEDEEVQEEIDVEYDQEFDQYEDEGDSKD
ncbi:UNKNOWN [Stylonychia lemnae]|uniref:Uncharacterized protein n=1 Tax=Stylonychia lemnae TaxID=5949 RepID=A0A077ZYB7_STYLE|nr:UNKNOWN [Stylonychia lemnae]|eukprot:CDW74906.1 UNKNOWN [Stylonychia lemnae]